MNEARADDVVSQVYSFLCSLQNDAIRKTNSTVSICSDSP